MIAKCSYCGKKLHRPSSRFRRYKRFFCNPKELDLFRRTGRYIPCFNCGKKKYVYKKALNQHKHHFCSDKCLRTKYTGKFHPSWRGGAYLNDQGYRIITLLDGRRVREHRYVMEKTLGRKLYPFENVHHKNGHRADNRPENLELFLEKQPTGQRVNDWLKFLVKNYRQWITCELKAIK